MAQATLSINANLNIQQVLNSIKQIKGSLNGLSLPKNLNQQFGNAASKLEKSLNELSLFSGKELNIDEAKQALKIIQDIQKAGVNFQGVLKNIGGLDLKSLKLDSFAKSYDDITNAVKRYEQAVENAKKSTTNAYAKAQTEQKNLKSQITAAQSSLNEKTVKRDVALLDLEAEKQKLEEAKRIAEEYKKTVSEEVYNKSSQKANVDATEKRVTTLQKRATDINTTIDNLKKAIADYEKQIAQFESTKKRSISATPAVQNAWNEIINLLKGSNAPGVDKIAKYDLDAVNSALKGLETSQAEKVKQLLGDIQKNANGAAGGVDQLGNSGKSLKGAVTTTEQFNRELDMMQNRIQYFFGLNNSIQLLKRGLREAYNTVKELDSAMTETAVVTDYTVSDMWDQLPLYTETANQLGATTLGAYQTMTLFYQQGLKTNAAFQLGTETMKMARIANMEYATATDMMTAALRGFNMALNETSAKRINDVYSELAAITAADTEEIATAMTKTASIANSANMEFETTAAFLSQIIETTREAPETAGTALKTIIARFTEVKQLYSKGQLTGKDSEGEAININKIDTALQSVGLSLKGFLRGEEGLDDILLQLASKWDTLDIATQRYIATMAAGSRQQSRFLAMMSDYDRTLELVEAANTSAGASDRQFEKTLDSLESKLNKLSNAWDQFTMGLADNKVIKLAVDGLTALLDIVNKLTNIPGGGILKILLGASVLRGGGTLLQTGVNWLANTLTGGAGKGAIFTTLQQAGVPNLDQMSKAEMSSTYKGILGRQFLGPFYGLGDRIKASRATNFSKASNINKDLQWQQLQKISGVFINDSTSIEKAKKIIASNPSMQAQAMTQLGLYSNFSGKLGTKLAKVGFGTTTSWGKRVAESGFAKKIASSFGLIEAGAGTAAGALASLASVLGIVAAVAAAVYGAVKLYDNLNISTEEAKKNVSNLAEAKNTAKENKDSYDEQIKSYKELQKTLKNTTKGTSKWNDALTANNDVVLQMASQFSDLSYEVDAATGALQLAEEDTVAASLEKGVKDTAIVSALAESYSLSRQAEDKKNKASAYATGGHGSRLITEQNLIEADAFKNESIKLANQGRAQFESAINQMDLGDSEASRNLSSVLSEQVLTNYNNSVEELARQYTTKGKDSLYSELTKMYGLTGDQVKEIFGDDEFFNEEYARMALASGAAKDSLQGNVEDIITTLTGTKDGQLGFTSEQVGTLNDILAGVSDVDLSNLDSIDPNKIPEYLGVLYDGEELQKKIGEFYTNFANTVIDQTRATMVARKGIGSVFDSLSSEMQLNVAEMLSNAQERFGVDGALEIQKILAKATEAEISQVADDLTTIYSKIDFSNPIKALKQINNYANSTNGSIKALGDALLLISEDDTSILGTSAQFKYLYENIFSSDENIQDLLDDLGELDADDIYDLADSFSDVDDFLKKGKTTAAGLAAVLNEINNNGLNANLITGGFLEAMSQANSYTSNMLDTIKKLDSIDFGTDYGQVSDTVGEWAEQWKEMINNGELGNQQVAKMYDYWYGEGSWVKLAESGIDNVKTASIELYNYLNSVAERGDMAMVWKNLFSGGEAITGENFSAVWDEANNQILWNIENGASFNEILTAVQEKGKQLGLNFSEEVYRMMLTDAANQSLDLSRLVDAEGVESALNILLDSIGESGIVDQAQLDAIYNTATDIDQARQIGEELIKQKGLIVDEWAPDTLSKGIAAGFNEATKAVGEYQKAIAGAFDKVNDKDIINIDTLTQFASKEDVFAQLVKGAEDAGATITDIWSKEFGNITVDWSKVKDDFGGDLNAYIQDAIDTAQTLEYADAIGQAVSNALTKLKIEDVDASSVSEAIKTAIANADKKVKLTASISGSGTISVEGKQFKVTVAGAMGGYVPSYAAGSGNNKLSKGPALTGEEAPEIVWNKEKGYAYLAGANGPEYNNLQPGDRVFNKEETRKILRNSKRKKRPSLAEGGFIVPSYGIGKPAESYKPTGDWIGGSAAVSSDKEDKDKWKNEFDWLYNLLEDIAELERDQNKLNEKYEDYLEDINKTAADLVKITTQELSNLYAQQARQQLSYDKRIQEMNEYLAVNSDLAQYGRYNFDDMTIEIDWDAIEAVQDQELYSKIEDYVEGLEDIQDKIDEADDALIDIENDIQDIEQRFQEEYVDFENRILDAIVNSRKQQIDQLSEINDSIKDTNSKLLDAVQKSLEQQRQDRENQKTEDEIAEKERRLSFLRQDTSRDNTLDILALEDELKDLKEDYTDELIDQKLTLLQDQEDFAAEQRERQIALMESQLDYDKETGQMWEEINALIQGSIGSDGKLINDSALANLLRDTENWASLSDVQKQLWEDTLITDFNAAYAYVLMQGVDQVKLKMNEITNMMDTIAKSLPNYSQAKEKNPTSGSGGGGSGGSSGGSGSGNGGNGGSGNNGNTGSTSPSYDGWRLFINGSVYGTYSSKELASRTLGSLQTKAALQVATAQKNYDAVKNQVGPTAQKGKALDELVKAKNYLKSLKNATIQGYYIKTGGSGGGGKMTMMAYATGGLNTTTGPAWLDGTKSKPELVLNAKDTQNFLTLKDILSEVMTNSSSTDGTTKKGDTYINVSVQAELSNDYDVEKLTKKIKDEIYKDGSYRGVNIIHKIR